MKLSIILPAFAEKESLEPLVKKLSTTLGDLIHEIIFITSPNSPEETCSTIECIINSNDKVRVVTQRPTGGLGIAVRDGMAAATGSHLLLMDSDGEMDPDTVPLMITRMEATGCDVVVGSRWIAGGGVQGYSSFKYVLNRLFQFIFRVLYRTPIHDLTLGFKLMDRNKISAIQWNSVFHEIAAETTLRPLRKGLKVEETPTIWVCRRFGKSNNPFRRNIRYLAKAFEILLSQG